jgi:putative endonuclease
LVRSSRIDRQQIGRAAEQAAVRFLEAKQLSILKRNYRCRTGEIDIIAETIDGIIVIAEVRLRSTANFGGGAASVDWRKQQRIQRATCHLLSRHPSLQQRKLRFDVLDLAPDQEGGYCIEWLPQAFDATAR